MEGTNLTRILRLAGNLATHPRDFPRYLLHHPLWKRTPVDLGLPWIAYGAIDFLESWLRPEHLVFEYGSGGSSIFLARRAKHVRSVENDPRWLDLVVGRARNLGLKNLDCEYHPLSDANTHDYAQQSYFNSLGPGPYDLILIDGFCCFSTGKYGRVRVHAFQQALNAVRRPGGIIMLDDYWMFPEVTPMAAGAKLTVWESTGPCRYGVTNTAAFQF